MPPYVGEIRIFAGNFPPNGWMFCEGQALPISENEVLFQLIGTTYGGDGEETFNLPDLRGRAPLHMGAGTGLSTYVLGQAGGVEQVTLTVQQIPSHNHGALATTAQGNQSVPAATTILASMGPAGIAQVPCYAPPGGTQITLNANTIGGTGGNQPHENMQPFLCLDFIISLFGVFPTQT